MGKITRTKEVEDFLNAILLLENIEECCVFLEDVCTANEVVSFAQRFQVARMLKNKKTYQEIAEASGASTATISRVKRSIDDGGEGYKLIFERMKNKNL